MTTGLLSVADVAEMFQVKHATVYSYLSRGVLPPPDARVGRSPLWTKATITAWAERRPGRGHRSDLGVVREKDVREALRQVDKVATAMGRAAESFQEALEDAQGTLETDP